MKKNVTLLMLLVLALILVACGGDTAVVGTASEQQAESIENMESAEAYYMQVCADNRWLCIKMCEEVYEVIADFKEDVEKIEV